MLSSLPPAYLYLLAFAIAVVVSVYTVRKIIFIARKRKIFDIPDNIRKIHGEQIPSLGGVGIFVGYMASLPFFMTLKLPGFNFIIISSVILFFTGVYDDIMNMRPSKKLVAQLLATFVAVYFADIRIVSLYGLLGIYELPFWVSVGLTTFCGAFFINVFNFIDGIDGLACMTSVLCSLVFGMHFIANGETAEACVVLAFAGATMGLLWFNYSPARIYMGDTGSMLSGFTIFVVALLFIRSAGKFPVPEHDTFYGGRAATLATLAVLFLPVFDALRVFVLRGMYGISPLKADRRHLHYYLLDAGLSHVATAWLLTGINMLTILIAFTCLGMEAPAWVLLVLITVPAALTSLIAARYRKKA